MVYCKLVCRNAADSSSPYYSTQQKLIRLRSGDVRYICFDIFEECCIPVEYRSGVVLEGLLCDFMRSDYVIPITLLDITLTYELYDGVGDTIQEGEFDISGLTTFEIKVLSLNPGYYTLHLTVESPYSTITTTIPVVVSG
jgi:hypothetical protein